ncbi:hypothetical protein [Kordiimonas pumila]|uniref:Uncharacterized protein n=1 Tax=Kordiimonas pumila TaxID=2161677 RepID=A0ABV7D126_9PROT|nr:hypothetical protein [Kordiimonas pumila]
MLIVLHRFERVSKGTMTRLEGNFYLNGKSEELWNDETIERCGAGPAF